MDLTDEQLLSALRAGDDDALRALIERHASAVYRFGARMCRDPEDAKDVVQDTLLAAARGLRGFRGGSSVSTWLFTIARSFCIKKRRVRVGAPRHTESLDSGEADAFAAPGRAPDEAASDREIGRALEAAIDGLDPMYREVLLLRDVEGLTAPEVAGVVGIGVDAVKSRLHRARVAVRDALSPLLSSGEAAATPTCPDVVPLLSRYVEGEIGAAECAEMDRHVSRCATCRERCDSLRRVMALCRRSGEDGQLPPAVQARIRQLVRECAERARPA